MSETVNTIHETVTLNKQQVADLVDAALEIAGDFHSYGPVLQMDNDEAYGPDSGIEALARLARETYEALKTPPVPRFSQFRHDGQPIIYVLTHTDVDLVAEQFGFPKPDAETYHNVRKGVESFFGEHWQEVIKIGLEHKL